MEVSPLLVVCESLFPVALDTQEGCIIRAGTGPVARNELRVSSVATSGESQWICRRGVQVESVCA